MAITRLGSTMASLLNKATYEYAKTVNTRKPNTVEAEVRRCSDLIDLQDN